MSLLPSTVYVSSPRLARARHLNTIVEEKEDASQGVKSDSEGDGSDSTLIGRPAAWNPALFVAAPRKSSLARPAYTSSPISTEPSPVSSAGEGIAFQTTRSSYASSEGGTVFSDDCPSLASDPTTFASDSNRSSVASNRSGRNRYPPLRIPRDSWESMDGSVKEIALGISPVEKYRLSPHTLSALSAIHLQAPAPPSLGDGSSVDSKSDVASCSDPATPDMHQVEVREGHSWTGQEQDLNGTLEIVLDDEHSIVISPADVHEAHSAIEPMSAKLSTLMSPLSARDWTDMVINFPKVPGATPQDLSPLMPTIDEIKPYDEKHVPKNGSNGSEPGVRLPLTALQTLQRLARHQDEMSDSSGTRSKRSGGSGKEMRELTDPDCMPSRPHSAGEVTPVSDYSLSQLSIPSPGGFFASLQTNSRHTWCVPKSQVPSVPDSATAEMFYNKPWEPIIKNDFGTGDNIVETTLTVAEDTNLTEGPPTARQPIFSLGQTSAASSERARPSEKEEDDMYGPASAVMATYEYDEKYYDELRTSAAAHIDRTGSWLAAQTGYLAALMHSDPDMPTFDNPPAPPQKDSKRRTVQFTEIGSKAKDCAVEDDLGGAVKQPSSPIKDPIFLSAFAHHLSTRRRRDAFIHASSRLEAIKANRVVLPQAHITSLLGQAVLSDPTSTRPKYSGPFSQNPRATCIVEQTPEQLAFRALEREQAALDAIAASTWTIDALRTLYNGRLVACPAAHEKLRSATTPLTSPECQGKKRLRVLDLGGSAACSWAWAAAHEYPNVKIYTVLTKQQAANQYPTGLPRPASPPNHRVVSVPYLWQLPFRAGHFDVVSARSLHMLLKATPVPGVDIDEWTLVLREMMRVLKPGGWVDYMVMDSGVARAGPLGEKMGVEFGFELHRRGYEREAGRSWLKRLKREGFGGVKRGWVFMPVGAKNSKPAADVECPVGYTGWEGGWKKGAKPFVPAPRPISEVSTISKIVRQYMDVEAVQGPVGSTADVADLTGLLGARMWEEWIVKVRKEAGREESRWLEGIDDVIEEGKQLGSGWKVLVGWAVKPKPRKEKQDARGEITVQFATQLRDQRLDGLREEVLTPSSEGEMGVIPMVIQG